MKAIVLSDTHGDIKALDYMVANEPEAGAIIHAGDFARDLINSPIFSLYKSYTVNGNCDGIPASVDEAVIEWGKCRILLTHGHIYGVKEGLAELSKKAISLACKTAIYGHTHIASQQDVNGVLMLNPGTGSYAKSIITKPSYIVLDASEETGIVSASLKLLI
ncbi:MAG: YfcE family phosphodiesterase [Eubacteriaceae bacterium]|nr:YfcE family phosphodiesterase [Eubacteriaceae bacterium]